ncbi:MAG TPA: 50S ribosomal protein L11 methyltransferase [Labilithrix sp.]|jgi:predicted nicotinamide N-methyase|nr:50S ribosomal protein L11 methyltransferase [Labilithrix sp.]
MSSPSAPSPEDAEDHTSLIRSHTALEPVPMVSDIRLYTATELVPLWRATQAWLADRGLGVPFWCVPWAGGQALARWVLDNPAVVRGRRVLDFGTGSGLIAIAAAKAGAAEVRAVDVDPVAVTACMLNAKANDVVVHVTCEDIVDDVLDADVLLAGDVWYELAASARFARWFGRLSENGTRVFTGDPGRLYVPSNTRELAVYEVPTSMELESSRWKTSRVLEVVPLPLRRSD